MRINKYLWIQLVFSSMGLFFLTSCCPEFKNPLPLPEGIKADQEITGSWNRLSETGGKELLCIFPRESGWLDIIYIYEIDSNISTDGPNVLKAEEGHVFLFVKLCLKNSVVKNKSVKLVP